MTDSLQALHLNAISWQERFVDVKLLKFFVESCRLQHGNSKEGFNLLIYLDEGG